MGCVFAIGVYVKLCAPPNYENFGPYMCIMSIFHYSEFLVLALISPKLVSTNSFVINHSPEYTFAATFSWIEFFIESYFWPSEYSSYLVMNSPYNFFISFTMLSHTYYIVNYWNFGKRLPKFPLIIIHWFSDVKCIGQVSYKSQ